LKPRPGYDCTGRAKGRRVQRAFHKEATQTPRDITIQAEKYFHFTAYAKEDIVAMTQMWGTKSHDLGAAKNRLQSVLSINDRIEVRNLQVQVLAVEGERASLLATA